MRCARPGIVARATASQLVQYYRMTIGFALRSVGPLGLGYKVY
jgi:hypothetical protein